MYCLLGVYYESIRGRMHVDFTLRRMQFSVIIGITRKTITVTVTAPIDSNLEDKVIGKLTFKALLGVVLYVFHLG